MQLYPSRQAAVRALSLTLLVAFTLGTLTACSNVYYGTWEALGVHKREIMTDRVQDARDDQEEAKEQFASAMEKFSAMFDFEGGELGDKYKSLKSELDDSESKAAAVTGRINSVESVSQALFDEWEAELEQYANADLRSASEEQLNQTRTRYDHMVASMRTAESKMEPVLEVFRDQVLFLKHNLNARAITSIEGTVGELEVEVAGLIAEMEVSIREADEFIASMGE